MFDKLFFRFFEKSKRERFGFSQGNIGIDIHTHPAIQEADIIHLHWIHFGFLSLDSLKKLFALGKPIIWTLHDMWAFTGGCHYSGSCTRFTTHCQQCPYLRCPSDNDLSFRVFERKKEIFQDANIHVVTCSQWLGNEAKGSLLFGKFPIISIPNPINTEIYQPSNKAATRAILELPVNKKLVLFGAMNTQEPRKGFIYLLDALTQLAAADSLLADSITLVVFGKADKKLGETLPFPVHSLGYVNGDENLAQLYNACDVMVFPSLEENLPNTIMESLACGTPVVAFRTGGVPEMIVHQQNGYLATLQSAEDLAAGIAYVLDENHYTHLATQARKTVLESFTEKIVSDRYKALYAQVLNQ